jgi:hypothetical protein
VGPAEARWKLTNESKDTSFLMNDARDRVNEFALPQHEDHTRLLEKVQKTPQPVLTRWWCVGVAAAFLTNNICIVLCVTRTCTNTNDADSRPNRNSSGLQSLMKQDVACSDMLLWLNFTKIGPLNIKNPASNPVKSLFDVA